MVAELTPTEAIEAREAATTEKAVQAEHKLCERAPLSDVQAAVERLQLEGLNNLPASELRPIVDIVAAVLRTAGAAQLLQKIASDLELRALHNVARAVRAHIHGDHEPAFRGHE